MDILHDFDGIISPVPTSVFFSEFFKKKPLLIQREQPGFFHQLLSMADMAAYLERKDLCYPSVRVVKDGMELPLAYYVDQEVFGNRKLEKINNEKMFALVADGATVVGQQLNWSFPALYALSQHLVQVFQSNLNINAYLTPTASKAFRPHYDTHEVLALQLHGSKDWKLYDMATQDETGAFEKKDWKATPPSQVFTLREGDTLYIPKGFVHEACGVDEPSLHLTIGLSLNNADLAIKNFGGHGGRLADVLQLRNLEPESRVRRRRESTVLMNEQNGALNVVGYGFSLTFPSDANALVTELMNSPEVVVVGELIEKYPGTNVIGQVRKLVQWGVLRLD